MGQWLIFNNMPQFNTWHNAQMQTLSIPKTKAQRPDKRNEPVTTTQYARPMELQNRVICSIDDRADTTGLTVHTHEDLVQLGYLSNDVE